MNNKKYDNFSENEKMIKVKNEQWAIDNISNPSELIQLEAVKEDSWNIAFLTNPSEKILKLAISKDPFAIQFITNPSFELKKLALKQNLLVLEYIEVDLELQNYVLENIRSIEYKEYFLNNCLNKITDLSINQKIKELIK